MAINMIVASMTNLGKTSEKHHSHPSDGMGREWGEGQGHIGKAFADRSAKITSDASHPEVAALMMPPGEMTKAYDQVTYRSYASFPIGLPIDDPHPIGVLVATSNQVGRFNKANCLILELAASVLANVLSRNDMSYTDLCTADSAAAQRTAEG